MSEKLPMIDEKDMHKGCKNCSNVTQILEMGRVLAVGFGDVNILRNGVSVYSEQGVKDGENFPTAQQAETAALDDPEQDWRISFFSPLHEEVYQRQGLNNWVMISSGPGFA